MFRLADRTLSTASVLALLAGLTLAGCSALQSRQSTPSEAPTSTPAEAEPQTARGADEPVQIVGTAEITFILFEAYLTEPFVMLEDEAGFVHRDFEFVAALASQVLGGP